MKSWIETRAMRAAELYITRQHGWEIIERGFPSGEGSMIVADDGYAVHLVDVAAAEGGFPAIGGDGYREGLEEAAARWCGQLPEPINREVVFDALRLCIIGGDRALLKMMGNVLATPNV